MAPWRGAADIEFVYTGGDGYWSRKTGGLAWTEPRCPVASVTGTTITMAQPCWDNSTKRRDPHRRLRPDASTWSARPRSATGPNRPMWRTRTSCSTSPASGTWTGPRTACTTCRGRARTRPRPTSRRRPCRRWSTAGVPRGDPIHDVAFKGIRFAYATWLRPGTGEGLSEIQADVLDDRPGRLRPMQGLCRFADGGTCPYGNWTKDPGQRELRPRPRHRVRPRRVRPSRRGRAGPRRRDPGPVVKGGVFTDISGNGIELGGVDDPLPTVAAEPTSGNQIADNTCPRCRPSIHGGVGDRRRVRRAHADRAQPDRPHPYTGDLDRAGAAGRTRSQAGDPELLATTT